VARANGAIEILASSGTPLRASGWLLDMEKSAAAIIKAGETIPANTPSSFQIAAVGPERPGRARTRFAGGVAEGEPNGLIDREAVVILKCDSPPLYDVCSVGGQMIAGPDPIVVVLPGGYRFELHEVLPMTTPAAATATVRFTGPAVSLIQPGDQDQLLDVRGAKVTAVSARDASSATVTLALGLDESREGWRYRGRVVRPGGALAITTDRYETTGQVLSISVQPAAASTTR
jgi:hypothetical protein